MRSLYLLQRDRMRLDAFRQGWRFDSCSFGGTTRPRPMHGYHGQDVTPFVFVPPDLLATQKMILRDLELVVLHSSVILATENPRNEKRRVFLLRW